MARIRRENVTIAVLNTSICRAGLIDYPKVSFDFNCIESKPLMIYKYVTIVHRCTITPYHKMLRILIRRDLNEKVIFVERFIE